MSAPVDARAAAHRLTRAAGPARLDLLGAALAGLGATVGTVLLAWAVATLAQHAVDGGGRGMGTALALGGAGALLRGLGTFAHEAWCARGAARVLAGVRAGLLSGLWNGAPPPSAGPFAYGVLEQVDRLEPYYARFLPRAALAVLAPLLLLGCIFPVNAVAGTLLLLSLPLIPLGMALVGLGAQAVSEAQLGAVRRLSAVFLDRLQGVLTLRRLGAGDLAAREIGAASGDLARRSLAVLRIALLSSAALEFFSTFAVAMVATYVGLSLLRYVTFGSPPGGMTLFQGVFVLLLAPACFAPLRALAAAYHDRADALAAADALMPAGETRPPQPAPAASDSRLRRITLRGVSVTYPGRAAGVRDIDLALSPDEIVVLSGPSGAGKSTVLGVLAGLIAPDAGEVEVAGISDAPGWLRANSAWTGQRPYLFPGSLAENIALGRPEASREEIAEAADRAGVGTFAARLPLGLDTPIGERGAGLSGGERQRVALARALLRGAPLLIFDEPTAHLDDATEAEVLAAIARVSKGRAVVIAAHRPAALRLAHRVVRLDAGRVASPPPREVVHA